MCVVLCWLLVVIDCGLSFAVAVPLFVARCSLLVVCCLLRDVWCSSCVVCYLMCVVCLLVGRCLCVVC